VKGAQAIAGSIFMARKGYSKEEIGKTMANKFDYNLDATVLELIPSSSFAACQASVPPAIKAFVDSNSYEDAVRRAVIMGGDSDTIAAMAGSIAEAYYKGVPTKLRSVAFLLLPLSMRKTISHFRQEYNLP
jgi:ADP-ribosylglycohydrolase